MIFVMLMATLILTLCDGIVRVISKDLLNTQNIFETCIHDFIAVAGVVSAAQGLLTTEAALAAVGAANAGQCMQIFSYYLKNNVYNLLALVEKLNLTVSIQMRHCNLVI